MGKAYPTSDESPHRGHFVEVAGYDGTLHHVGPFKLLADAELWIERHAVAGDTQPLTQPVQQIPHAV